MNKKILLIRNAYSFDFGGAELFPVSLALELKKLNLDTIVTSRSKKLLSYAKKNNVSVLKGVWWSRQNWSGKNTILFPVFVIWQIILFFHYFFVIIYYKIDAVHPQSRDDFISATLAGRLLGKKVVWTDHADIKYIYMNHKIWYKNPVGKLVYLSSKLANHVTIESISEKKLIECELGKELPANYKVVHIGVVDNYKPRENITKKLVIVATSRLVKEKGIGELIKAIKLINASNIVLKICGDGPDAAQFKREAEGIVNIEFLGHIDDVSKILQNSDILVHPSYHESFGLSLVEAEMHSLPIVACKVGSIPEIVKDGVSGILVKPRDSDDLAKALDTLIKNPRLRTEMGDAGRQIFLDMFQFDKIVKNDFLPLYEK